MYIKNNKYYADAGSYLKSGATIGYELPQDMEDVKEIPINLEDMKLRTSKAGYVNAHCTGGVISFGVKNNSSDEPTYAKLKTDIIKMRYSNDDQIAIMLNVDNGNEDSANNYKRMQDWRTYATNVAKKIMEIYDERGTQSASVEQPNA